MGTGSARLTGMPFFRRPLIIESALAVSVTRARVRSFAASRGLSEIEAFRRRQIIGWRLSELHEDFLFQPEYGDALNIDGARFIGLVEAAGAGSRIRGYIVLSLLSRIVVSAFIFAVILAATIALGESRETPASVLSIATTIVGGVILMVRYSLRSASRLAVYQLRRCLEASRQGLAA